MYRYKVPGCCHLTEKKGMTEMSLSDRPKNLRLLAVVAHPHDITHMCGTLAHHVSDGDAVTAVSVTGGLHTHRQRLYDEMRKPPGERDLSVLQESDEEYEHRKASEFRQVCALFGISDARILPFPDWPWKLSDELVQALTEIILEVRPDIVLTHAPKAQFNHGWVSLLPQDDPHSGTGRATHLAISCAGMPDDARKRQTHAVAAVLYTGVDLPIEQADIFIDITDQAANRIKAEKLFTTQDHTAEFANKRIQIGAGFTGWTCGASYAEAWVRARPQFARRIDLTDQEVERNAIPSVEYLARVGKVIME